MSASYYKLDAGQPPGRAELAGVLLHGRDRTAEEMLDVAAQIDLTPWRWVAPAADVGSWYPHRFMDPRSMNEMALETALTRCTLALDDASESGRLGPERLALVGFSQGACVACEFVLRHPQRCRALIMFTGSIIGTDALPWRREKPRLDGIRVLITGSDVDEWVDQQRVRDSAEVLRDCGADVRLRIYQGRPHMVGPPEIEEARGLLQDLRFALPTEPPEPLL